MEAIIALTDAASIGSCVIALIIVGVNYKKVFQKDVSLALVMLLALHAAFMTCLFLKWSGLAVNLLAVEDTIGTLLPAGWAFLFYTLVQEIITTDIAKREGTLKKEVEERKLAEEKARQYSIKLSVMVNNFSSALLMETANREIEFTNHLFCQMFSVPLPPENLQGMDCRQSAQSSKALFKNPEDFCNGIEAAIATGKEVCFEVLETVDNKFFERDYVPVYDNNRLIYHLWVYRDVTHRILSEKAIKNAAAEWRTTFDSIPDMIAITDDEHRITRINRAFAKAFGFQPVELLGKKACPLIHGREDPVDDCPCIISKKTGKPATKEFLHTHKNTNLEVTSSPIVSANGDTSGSVLVIRDMTERKLIQQQLIFQDRLASIGELVSGVAHELNNPLTSIIGFSDYLLQGELPADVKEAIEYINQDARRTASIVNNLMIFAREQPMQKAPLDINEILNRVLILHEYPLTAKGIIVHTSLSEDIPPVMGNSAQLHQVFSNIFLNAEQAMYDSDKKGILHIKTEKLEKYVRITLADSGPGIAEIIIDKIFNPFFTTRKVGQGTGLGLSISHGIITEHGGNIRAENKPGNGAVFIIELPSIILNN